MQKEILDLTKSLVGIKSVNGTAGERKVADYIYAYFSDMPYFKAHPENLFFQPIPDDPLERGSVVAVVEGIAKDTAEAVPGPSVAIPDDHPDRTGSSAWRRDENPKAVKSLYKRTLLLHGHIDTVGTEDFGPLEQFCTDPDMLCEKMKEVELPQEVRADLESGDYMFGRGSVDMKSGDAVFMVLLKYYSEHTDELHGNLIGSFNPVEENMHTGIITTLPLLIRLREERGYEYIGALNNDFSTRLYPGDEQITLYTGAGGKILPCFYIRGRETHVGQCFEGVDASAIAAELIHTMNLSTFFSDEAEGEMAPPPTVLKLKDLKRFYNVQTSKEALVYFNMYVYEKDMRTVTERLIAAAQVSCMDAEGIRKEGQKEFQKANHLPKEVHENKVRTMTYSTLLEQAEHVGEFDPEKLEKIAEEALAAGTDKREVPIDMIRYLLDVTKQTEPVVVLYYAPPYIPHCKTNRTDEKSGAPLYRALKETVQDIEGERRKGFIKGPFDPKTTKENNPAASSDENEMFRILNYYPSLSDSSFLKIDDDEASLEILTDNFPAFDLLNPLPLEKIKALDIPVMNIGTYGFDAHKWTERVNIPYTFGILPELEMKLIRKLFNK